MNNYELSTIIVTYNNENEIQRCLQSLHKAVSHIHTQLIIIDNNSTDETCREIDKSLKNFQHYSYIVNEKNLGFTKASNQALKQSTGEHILLLNPDTDLPEKIFSHLFKYFKNDRSLGVVSPQFLNSDGTIQSSCRRFPRHRDILYNILFLNKLFPGSKEFNYWKMGDFDHKSLKFVEQPQGAFLLTHREVLDKVGLLDESFPMFFSDVDWCWRIIEQKWKILFIPEVQIIHHKGRSVSQNKIPLVWSSHISFSIYFKKHYRGSKWKLINLLTGILLMLSAAIRSIYLFIFGR